MILTDRSVPTLSILKPGTNENFDGQTIVLSESGCTVSIVLICGGQQYNPFVMPDPTDPNKKVGTFFYFPANGECTLCVTSVRTDTGESITICVPIIINP
jgi:hypothetical protein